MQRLTGKGEDVAWKPALVEIEDAREDGRLTVFVPSGPTPVAGTVHILSRSRVHPLAVPFTPAVKSVSRWGQGSRELLAAMKSSETTPDRKAA